MQAHTGALFPENILMALNTGTSNRNDLHDQKTFIAWVITRRKKPENVKKIVIKLRYFRRNGNVYPVREEESLREEPVSLNFVIEQDNERYH